MTDHTTDQRDTEHVRGKLTIIIANKLWAGKSLDAVGKMELDEWQDAIDEIEQLFASHRKQLASEFLEALPTKFSMKDAADKGEENARMGFNQAITEVEQLIKVKARGAVMITYRGIECDERGHCMNELKYCYFCGVDAMRAAFAPCVEDAPRVIEVKAQVEQIGQGEV